MFNHLIQHGKIKTIIEGKWPGRSKNILDPLKESIASYNQKRCQKIDKTGNYPTYKTNALKCWLIDSKSICFVSHQFTCMSKPLPYIIARSLIYSLLYERITLHVTLSFIIHNRTNWDLACQRALLGIILYFIYQNYLSTSFLLF